MSIARKLIKIGNSKGLTLTSDMRKHLQVSETVSIHYLPEGILLTRPDKIEEAADLTELRFDDALRELAK